MEKTSKLAMYLCLISIAPILVSLVLTPWIGFELSIMAYITAPIYLIFTFIAIRYIRKDIVYHSFKLGKVTGRLVLIVVAVIPSCILLFAFMYGLTFTAIDFALFFLWPASSIIDIIAAIIYKPPKKT